MRMAAKVTAHLIPTIAHSKVVLRVAQALLRLFHRRRVRHPFPLVEFLVEDAHVPVPLRVLQGNARFLHGEDFLFFLPRLFRPVVPLLEGFNLRVERVQFQLFLFVDVVPCPFRQLVQLLLLDAQDVLERVVPLGGLVVQFRPQCR